MSAKAERAIPQLHDQTAVTDAAPLSQSALLTDRAPQGFVPGLDRGKPRRSAAAAWVMQATRPRVESGAEAATPGARNETSLADSVTVVFQHDQAPHMSIGDRASKPADSDAGRNGNKEAGTDGTVIPTDAIKGPPGPPRRPDREEADLPDPDPLGDARNMLRAHVRGHEADSLRISTLQQTFLEIEMAALRNKSVFLHEDPNKSRRYRELKKQTSRLSASNSKRVALADHEATEYMAARDKGQSIFGEYYRGLPFGDGLPSEGTPRSDKIGYLGDEGTHVMDLLHDQTEVSYTRLSKIVDEHGPEGGQNMAKLFDREIEAARLAQHELQRQIDIAVEAAAHQEPPRDFGVSRRRDTDIIYQTAEDLARADTKKVNRVPRPDDQIEKQTEFSGNADYGEIIYGPVTVIDATGRARVYEKVALRVRIDQPYLKQLPETIEIPQLDDPAELTVTSFQIWGNANRQPAYEYYADKKIDGDQVKTDIIYSPPTDLPEYYLSTFPHSERIRLKEIMDAVAVASERDRLLPKLVQNLEEAENAESERFAAAKERLTNFIDGSKPGSRRFTATQDTLRALEARYLEELFQRTSSVDRRVVTAAETNARRAENAIELHRGEKDEKRIYEYARQMMTANILDTYTAAAQDTVQMHSASNSILISDLIAVRVAQQHLAVLGKSNETKRQTHNEPQEQETSPATEESHERWRRKRYRRLHEKASAHLRADHAPREVEEAPFLVIDNNVHLKNRNYSVTITGQATDDGKLSDRSELTIEIGRRAGWGVWTNKGFDQEQTYQLKYVSQDEYRRLRGGIRNWRRKETVKEPADTEAKDKAGAEMKATHENKTVAVILGSGGQLVKGDELDLLKDLLDYIPNPTQ